MSSHVFDRAKWQSRSLFDQMGNIGSEVGRALAAKRRGDQAGMMAAYCRGLDLIDATVEGMVATKSARAKEVLRARDQFSEAIMTPKVDPALEGYFMNFALAARSGR